jgi:hypothetical protein
MGRKNSPIFVLPGGFKPYDFIPAGVFQLDHTGYSLAKWFRLVIQEKVRKNILFYLAD